MKQITKNTKFVFDKKDQTNKVGLGLSITILSLVALAFIAVFCDTHTYGNTLIVPEPKSGVPYYPDAVYPNINAHLLGYLCFVSGLLVAILSIINIVEFALVKTKKLPYINRWVHIVNLAMVSQQAFNFVFTITYLVPLCCITKVYNFEYLFTGSNLIFNVALPILVVFLYVFCFKFYSKKSWLWTLFGLIPTFLYFTIYMILAFSHANGSVTDTAYDLYWFGAQNKFTLIFAYISIMLIAIGICIGVDKLNKIGKLNRALTIAVVNIILAVCVVIFAMALMWRTNLINDYKVENLTQVQTFFMRFMFFTHLSNWWVGATCVIYAVYGIRIYKHKARTIPIWAQIARLCGIAAISITLLMQLVVAAGYMFNTSLEWHVRLTEGYIKCFRKHLLFEHFTIPFMSIVSFIVLEHTDLKWKHLLHSAAPMGIYTLCYAIVLYSTLGMTAAYEVNPRWVCPWDIYGIRGVLGSAGKYFYWILPFVVYGLMLVINWIFWYFNRKIHFEKPKKGSAIAELKHDWAEFKKWKLQRKQARK